MQEPAISKDSPFLERWSRAEVLNGKLGVVLMVMGFSFLSLTIALICTLTKARPIYYIPGALSSGVAFAQNNPKATVGIFTSSWVLNWTNFTPANVEDVYKRAGRLMSPRLLNQTKARLIKDIEEVKKNNMSSLFSLNQEPFVEEDRKGFNVTVQGDKGVYVGKEEIKLQKMVYRLRLRACPPTDWNPYGLIVEDISQEVLDG